MPPSCSGSWPQRDGPAPTRPQRLLVNRQRALVEKLGLHVLTLRIVERRQVVEALGHVGTMGADIFLGYFEGLLGDNDGTVILPVR